jgi:hypothetical protein
MGEPPKWIENIEGIEDFQLETEDKPPFTNPVTQGGHHPHG